MSGALVHGLLALVLAGLVHLSSLLLLPWLTTRDGFSRLASLTADNKMRVLTADEVTATLPLSLIHI